MPTQVLKGKAPIEILFTHKPNFSNLKVCSVVPTSLVYQTNKFQSTLKIAFILAQVHCKRDSSALLTLEKSLYHAMSNLIKVSFLPNNFFKSILTIKPNTSSSPNTSMTILSLWPIITFPD